MCGRMSSMRSRGSEGARGENMVDANCTMSLV
jgi:hypothetical protein